MTNEKPELSRRGVLGLGVGAAATALSPGQVSAQEKNINILNDISAIKKELSLKLKNNPGKKFEDIYKEHYDSLLWLSGELMTDAHSLKIDKGAKTLEFSTGGFFSGTKIDFSRVKNCAMGYYSAPPSYIRRLGILIENENGTKDRYLFSWDEKGRIQRLEYLNVDIEKDIKE